MILTDSCVLIEYLKENPLIQKKINDIPTENIVVNSIILMELFSGARNKRELNSIKIRLNKFQLLEINQSVMDETVSLLEEYHLSHGLKIPDAIIAATARYHDIPLYTFNLRDFKFIPDITFFD
jgi:tRNA(fMet)-specific endonuclease VapC